MEYNRSKNKEWNWDRKKTSEWNRNTTKKQTFEQEVQMWFEVLISKHWLITHHHRRQQQTAREHRKTCVSDSLHQHNTHWSLQHSRVLWWHDTHTSSSCFTGTVFHTHTFSLTHRQWNASGTFQHSWYYWPHPRDTLVPPSFWFAWACHSVV